MKSLIKCVSAIALVIGLGASFSVLASPCEYGKNWLSSMHHASVKYCKGLSNVYRCATTHDLKKKVLHVRITKIKDHGDLVAVPKVGKTINYGYGVYSRANACAMLYDKPF